MATLVMYFLEVFQARDRNPLHARDGNATPGVSIATHRETRHVRKYIAEHIRNNWDENGNMNPATG